MAAWASMACAAWADPTAQVRGDIPDDLRAQIVRAVGEKDDAPANRFQARRRAREAVESATALLRSEGYYQSTIEDIVEGEEAPVAIIAVTIGPRFTLAEPLIEWQANAPAEQAAAEVRGEMDLPAGGPGRAVDVIAAEGRIVAGLTRRGYADAKANARRVVVDHAQLSVAPTFRIASGELVRLDGIRLETRGPTNNTWVAGLAPWEAGDVYDPEDVAELERRLLETGVYDGVGVALAPADQNTADGERPVIVTLTDRPRRIVEAGVSISTSDGYGVDGSWTYYNRLKRADTLRFHARAATLDSRLGVELSLPHWRTPGRTLRLAGGLVRETTDAYDRTALALSGDIHRRFGRTSYISYGVGLDGGRYRDTRFDPDLMAPVTLDRDLIILSGRGTLYMDRSNDPLDPRRGWRLNVSLQPTAVSGDDNVFFLKAESQATGYLPLTDGGGTVLAGRLRIGSIVGGDELTVPSDRAFYSGGGGSVRGYSYQGVGPRFDDNTPRGGLSLFETSLEVRRDFGRSWGGAAFIDAGAIGFQETPNLSNLRYAAGFGVRYQLPFGPVRADIAVPLNRREGDASFQVYISIGQAF